MDMFSMDALSKCVLSQVESVDVEVIVMEG